MCSLTIPLDSEGSSPSIAGGKGHNLSILSRSRDNDSNGGGGGRILVPPGFVVTIAAYREFVRKDDGRLLREIEGLLPRDDDDGGDCADLEETSDAIRAAFRKRSLPDALRAEIVERLSSSFSSPDPSFPRYFAVRSSAACEDAPDASFAGQHDTYLNVPPDRVCERVVDCFSSSYTVRAISYRNERTTRRRKGGSFAGENDNDDDDFGMAVVVQAMVPSQTSSGVLFTANPLTGRRNESTLEAIPGLGEALVSGLTDPDRYVVARTMTRGGERRHDERDAQEEEEDETGVVVVDNHAICIKERKIGAKGRSIRSVEGGGVAEEETIPTTDDGDGTSQSPPPAVLTDGEVEAIVRIGQEVEALFGGEPQDIEWARSGAEADGRFYVVQSRPITTLFPLPNVPADPLRVFFSFNAVQGISAPITPAGQDALRRGLLGGLLRWVTWGRHGNEGAFLQTVAQRPYLDATNLWRNAVGRRVMRALLPSVEPGIAAALERLTEEDPVATSVNGGASPMLFLRLLSLALVIVPRILLSVVRPDWSRERVVRRVNKFVEEFETKAEEAGDLCDLVALEREVFQSLFYQIMPRLGPRFAAAIIPLFLLTKLASSIPNGKDLVLTITRGIRHNVTTEMDLKLWEVAKAIQNDARSLRRFKSADAESLAADYLSGKLPDPAQRAIREFMGEYGMRGLYEIDFGRPRWREEPAPLMNTLRSYVEMEEDRAPERLFASGRDAAEGAVRQLGEKLDRPRLVSFLASRIQSLAGLRELPKFTIIRIMGHLRARMLKEGEKLAKMGIIDHERDLFYLRMDEIESLAKGELDDPKGVIGLRKVEMERETEQRTRLPRVIASDGFAYYGDSAPASDKGGPNVLRGEPVSPGTYEGRIRIIHDPSKAKLSQGEILCCHGTDPSWTPLFLSAGALVMEVGGLMTHGSVVAREYGIPAVVGLNKVTEKLATGNLVRVDGSSGVVEIIE